MNTSRRFIGIAVAGGFLVAATSGARAGDLPPLELETYASGFTFPLAFVQDPQFPSVQYVVQQRGRIRVVIDGDVQGQDFIDLTGVVSTSGGERGLLGLAFPFDPDDDRFYINYTAQAANHATRIVRYRRDPNDPHRADVNSAEILMTIGQPFGNHNGGNVAFGPDGYLYIGMGDGGSAGDPGHRSQDPDTLLGKMLRIDVSPQNGFHIPADNPFVDDIPVDAREEIWAFGLRNPWRWSFDWYPLLGAGPRGTQALVIADVGQNAWEEVDYEPAGEGGQNYGWRNREGAHDFNQSLPPAYKPLIDPIHEYSHAEGGSITGGFVYRGSALGPAFDGRYFFGDFITRRCWSLGLLIDDQTGEAMVTDVAEHTIEMGGNAAVGNVASFGVDADGEIYIVNFDGLVRRIVTPKNFSQPESATRVRGIPVSGGLDEILRSDDERMVTRPDAFVPLPPPVQIEVTATSPFQVPASLTVRLESRVSVNNIIQRISFFKYTGNEYEEVDVRVASIDDGVVEVTVDQNTSEYIRNADGQVKILIQYHTAALSIPPTWVNGIDLVSWSIIE